MKETTVKHYVQNVAKFMDYMSETPTTTCRLTKPVLIRLWQEMRQVLKTIRRGMTMHQVAVKTLKETFLKTYGSLKAFRGHGGCLPKYYYPGGGGGKEILLRKNIRYKHECLTLFFFF